MADAAEPPPETCEDCTQLRLTRRKLERAESRNKILSDLIERNARSLYRAQEELRAKTRYMENVLASMHSAIFVTDQRGLITSSEGLAAMLVGRTAEELVDLPVTTILRLATPPIDPSSIDALAGQTHEGDLLANDTEIPVLVAVSELWDEAGERIGALFSAIDVSERKRLEVELRHAQRLESIGELAAGVAHEINTPIQFVSDSIEFIGDAVDDLLNLTRLSTPLRELIPQTEEAQKSVEEVEELEEDIELDFLADELPKAMTRTVEGLQRVSTIVQALKQFSHPGDDDHAPADINAIIENTLVVARNEYKYVAEIDLDLGEIPDVMCHRGDLGQVFLNVIVNAAHAIGARLETEDVAGAMGRITVSTQPVEDGVEVTVTDTGGGIPAAIQARVFEPFFTTKEPGKGTGQGLALAHNMVVKKHDGRITFEVEDGVGTTFHIWLPRKQGS